MQNDLDNIERERRDQEMCEEAFKVIHYILKSAQEGDKKARSALKQNKSFFLRMQESYEEFKHYKI